MFTFLLVIVGVGFWSFTDTVFELGSAGAAAASLASDDNTRVLSMWGANFAPLAGVLNVSYYLHTAAVPVIRATNRPERKYKDLAWGYFACMVAHVVTGVFGYVGFAGYTFRDYYAGNAALGQPSHTIMDENLDNMFAYDSTAACCLKLSVTIWMLTGYPVWSHFLMGSICKLSPRPLQQPLSGLPKLLLSTIIHSGPLLITLFYPKMGSVMAYVGATAGLAEVFILPVLLHLTMLRTQIEN